MSCFHPLKAFPIGVNPSGKPRYKICSYDVNHVFKSGDSWFCSPDPPISIFNVVTSFVEIPCGHCIGCRLEYSRQWANRLMLEASLYDSNYFVTLTYDNENLPENYYGDPSSGVPIRNSTLVLRDVQLFLKRLRKAIEPEKIRFYLCGEYGTKTMRPHYHAIIFGLHLPVDDLTVYKRSYNNDIYYNSDLLSRVWRKGFVVVSAVNWNTCAYVSRYVTKKFTGPERCFYDNFNIRPPFAVMSRKPGIAKGYFDTHDVNMTDSIVYGPGRSGLVPKYFEKFIEIEDPEYYKVCKESRKAMADARTKLKLEGSDLDYQSMLLCEESALLNRIKVLRRDHTEEVIL